MGYNVKNNRTAACDFIIHNKRRPVFLLHPKIIFTARKQKKKTKYYLSIVAILLLLHSQFSLAAFIRYEYIGIEVANAPTPFPPLARSTGFIVSDSNDIVANTDTSNIPESYLYSDGVSTVRPPNSTVVTFALNIRDNGSILRLAVKILSNPSYDDPEDHYAIVSGSPHDTTQYCYRPLCFDGSGRLAGSSASPGS